MFYFLFVLFIFFFAFFAFEIADFFLGKFLFCLRLNVLERKVSSVFDNLRGLVNVLFNDG